MNPKIWGPPGWIFLHSIAYGYPNEPSSDEKEAAIKLKYLTEKEFDDWVKPNEMTGKRNN